MNNRKILILNDCQLDKNKANDFADFNAKMLLKYFKGGNIIYFIDLIRQKGIKFTESVILNTIKEKNISIVFFAPNGNNYELSIEFFQSLRGNADVKMVLWVLDDELIFEVLTKYYSQVFDLAVTCDYFATFAYQKLNVPALYFFSNYSKKDFYPSNAAKDIDVSFVGDCSKADRMEYLNYLKSKGINIQIFGKGSKNGFVDQADLPKIFARSKINLNFTKIDKYGPDAWFLEDNRLTNLIRQNKGRPMEIAMTNSFCLSEYSPSLNVCFTIGEDLDVFYSKEDLYKKLIFYLNNDALRIKMSQNAYKKTASLYEVDIFMPKLVRKICDTLDNNMHVMNNDEIYKDRVFKKNHLIRLTITMLFQLSKFRFKPAFESFVNLFQYDFVIFCFGFYKGIKLSLMKYFQRNK